MHRCWQCGDSGQDNVAGGVFRCSVASCGRFYHRHCVELNTNSTVRADIDEVQVRFYCIVIFHFATLSCVWRIDACFRGSMILFVVPYSSYCCTAVSVPVMLVLVMAYVPVSVNAYRLPLPCS